MRMDLTALPPHIAPQPKRPPPASPRELFFFFTLIALQGFGGVLAVIQRGIVEDKGWLTADEFLDDWSVAQVLPGSNVINLSLMVGDRYFGLRGAMAALAGLLTGPLIVILLLALLYGQFAGNPQVAGALRGMGAVAGGLIAGTGFKLAAPLRHHPVGYALCLVLAVLIFGAIALLHVPLGWVLLAVGGTACILSWRTLAT